MLRVKVKDEILVFMVVLASAMLILCPKSMAVDAISIALYLFLAFRIFSRKTEMLLKYLHFFVMSTWAVFSLWPLEHGNIRMSGYPSHHYGSIPTYVFSWLIFYGLIYCLECQRARKNRGVVHNRAFLERTSLLIEQRIRWISFFALILVGICFLSIVRTPAYLLNVTRFTYAAEYLPWIVSFSLPFLYALIPVVLIIRRENKIIPALYLLLLVLLNIWMGEKFTGVIIILYFVCISISPEQIDTKKFRKRIKTILIGICVLILSLLALVNFQQSKLGVDIGEYLEYRLAAQGELWWRTYAEDGDQGTHMEEIWDELHPLIYQPRGELAELDFGIYKMMKKFMNPSVVQGLFNAGARATESTRATFFYYGKYIGLILGQILLAFVVYGIVNRCIEACAQKKWFLAFLLMYLMKQVITVTYMSDFYLLTQRRSILIYILLFFCSKYRFRMGRDAFEQVASIGGSVVNKREFDHT